MNPGMIFVGAVVLVFGLYWLMVRNLPKPEPHKVQTTTVTLHLPDKTVDRIFKDVVNEGMDDVWVYPAKALAKEYVHSKSHYFKLDDGSYVNKSQVLKITIAHGEE